MFKRVPGHAEWEAYAQGPKWERKYALLPISELVPRQRAADSAADDGQRTFDHVRIKGVSVRMTICHVDGVRLQCFVFRNGTRGHVVASTSNRPFEIETDVAGVPRRVNYEVLTRPELFGLDAEGDIGIQHVGVHDGPFAVERSGAEVEAWKTPDGTSFNAHLSKSDGRPVGSASVGYGMVSKTRCGGQVRANFQCGLQRTVSGAGGQVAQWAGSRFRPVEMYFELKEEERFVAPDGSRTVNARPLELWVMFDRPKSFTECGDEDTVSGTISGFDYEVYYDCH